MTNEELAEALVRWVERNSSVPLEMLRRLVALDAPTGDADLLAETEQLITTELQELGATVDRHPTPGGTHIEARLGPQHGAPVLILGHYDTVWAQGTAAARPLSLANGHVNGPGVFDMRGGLAAAMTALRALTQLELIDRPIWVLFTADEEAGSQSSQGLIEGLGSRAAVVLIPEPSLPGGGMKSARRGVLTYRVEVTGREAHAGLDPERGISAIRGLIEMIDHIEALADPSAGTQINVGVIAGGTRPNVVAGSAFAEVDVRITHVPEYERVDAAMSALPHELPSGARVAVTTVHARPPMERTQAIADAVRKAQDLASLLRLDLAEGPAGGGSDGNFLAPLGVSLVDGLGPEGDGAHAVDEFILLRSLEERTALLALLALRL